MELIAMEDFSRLDTREVTPADVVDALAGMIERGKCDEVVTICADGDGGIYMLCTDMANNEFLGFLEIAKANYIHSFQHRSAED